MGGPDRRRKGDCGRTEAAEQDQRRGRSNLFRKVSTSPANMGGPYPAPLITQVRKMRSGGSFCTLTAHEKPPERFNTCRFFGPDLKIV